MPTALRYASLIFALAAAALADAAIGIFPAPMIFLVVIALVSWWRGRLAGISAALCSLVIWWYIHQKGLATLGYGLVISELMIKSIIVGSASLLAMMVRGLPERDTEQKYTDNLTGLYTMQAFRDIAGREISRSSRYEHSFSIAYLDADNFSIINQTSGNEAGDKLLKCIAETMQTYTRSSDIVARMGGDNFLILLPETGYDQARETLDKIRTKLDEALSAQGYSLTFSIGIMTYRTPPATVDQALNACEAAMFHVKGSGKNAICHDVG